MLKLNYHIHLLLNSKYRLFVNFFIYIIILFIYSILINDITITECMDRQPPTTPQQPYMDYMLQLELENKLLKERIVFLENNLKNNIEQSQLNKLTYDAMLNMVAEKNRVLQARIDESYEIIENMLEENNALQQALSEQNRK